MHFRHAITVSLFACLSIGFPLASIADSLPDAGEQEALNEPVTSQESDELVDADKYVYSEETKPASTWWPFLRPAKDTPEKQLAFANAAAKKKHQRKAAKQYRRLVQFWPDSKEAAEAQLRYATLQQQRGKYDKAFYGYQKLVDEFEGKFEYTKILDRQFSIAKTVMKETHATFFFLPGYERPRDAIPYLEKIVENGPRWEYADEAQFLLGEIRETEKDFELAIVDYMNTMLTYPDSEYAERAALGRCRCLIEISHRSPNDIDAAQEAWYALTLFKSTYPDSTHQDEINDHLKQTYTSLARKSYEVALFYDEHTKKPKAALLAYEDFVKRYPSSAWTPQARERIQTLTRVMGQDGE